MRWRRDPTHRLVAASEVQRLTGFDAKEILRQRDTQRLVRIDGDGQRHEFVRIPVALLDVEAVGGDDSGG